VSSRHLREDLWQAMTFSSGLAEKSVIGKWLSAEGEKKRGVSRG